MRGKRELLMRKKASYKEQIKRYESAISENQALAESALGEYSAMARNMSSLSKERSKKKLAQVRCEMLSLSERCEAERSRILWYMNLISTSAESAALVAEKKSLKAARKIRMAYGKKRVAFVEKYEKAEVEYVKACALIPAEEKV